MLNDYLTAIVFNLMGADWSGLWPVKLTGEFAAFALVICFVVFAQLERRIPMIKRPVKQTRKSYRTNIGLFTFNNIFLSACSVSALFMVAESYSSYGLLQAVPDPTLRFLLAFLALDLLLYAWHRACHHYDTLWLFHRVHHNDPELNVSTAFRLHFLELVSTNFLKVLFIVVLGIDKMLVLAIETITTLCIMFHHSNIAFSLERKLSAYIIVPALHRVHHSTERHEHDRNFGAVLTLWDKLFGTLLEGKPKAIGIKGRSPQDLINLVKFGLGVEAAPQVQPVDLNAMVAEAAYYKAEKRNFYPGYEMRDWLEAKKEILNQVSGKHYQWDDTLRQQIIDSLKIVLSDVNRSVQQTLKNGA